MQGQQHTLNIVRSSTHFEQLVFFLTFTTCINANPLLDVSSADKELIFLLTISEDNMRPGNGRVRYLRIKVYFDYQNKIVFIIHEYISDN